MRFLEAAGDAAAAFYSNSEAFSHYQSARDLAADAGDRARIGEKQGDVALRLGRVDAAIAVWEECLEHHRTDEDLERVADLHRKIGAGLRTRASARRPSSTTRRASTCSRTARPASSSCACTRRPRGCTCRRATTCSRSTRPRRRCAWPSGWGRRAPPAARTASSAACSGGSATPRKARENLERSVELARGSDDGETILALLALGHHLEISEADYSGAAAAYREGLALADEVGDVPPQVELHAGLAQLAVYRADWDEVRRSSEASAELSEREGLVGKLCLPSALRGLLHWRDGEWDEAERAVPPRPRARGAGGLVRGRLHVAVRARGACCATAATPPAP